MEDHEVEPVRRVDCGKQSLPLILYLMESRGIFSVAPATTP